MVSDGGQAAPGDQADVAAADDANLHVCTLRECASLYDNFDGPAWRSRTDDVCEFIRFGALERPFGAKKHPFADGRSIPGRNLRKIEAYPETRPSLQVSPFKRKSGKELRLFP
jgi:hypothetical protein